MKRLLTFIGLLICMTVKAQISPNTYWQFEGGTPLVPAIGSVANTINPSTFPYTINTGGLVGSYMTKDLNSSGATMTGGNLLPSAAISIEFLIRPGRNFQKGRNAIIISVGEQFIQFEYPYVTINTSPNTGIADRWDITLDQCGKGSWSVLQDGNWHHIAIVYNAPTGRKELWIDGQNPAMFQRTIATSALVYQGNTAVYFANTVDYTQYAGDLDEVAVYFGALSGNQIYKNFLEANAGQHYTATAVASVPSPAATTGLYNSLEYAPNYPTFASIPTPITQLLKFPVPRYRPILTPADSLLTMLSFADPFYLGGALQTGISNSQAVLNGVEVNMELAKDFNWALNLWGIGDGTFAGDSNALQGKTIKRANANTQYKLQAVSFWTTPPITLPSNYGGQGYAAGFYLQNGAATPYNINNNSYNSGPPLVKVARPSKDVGQSAGGFPDATTAASGTYQGNAVALIDAALTRPINFLSENGEIFQRYPDGAMNTDPTVAGWVTGTGWTNIKFQSTWRARLETNYRDAFIGTTTATTGTNYAVYQIQGNPNFFHEWAEMKSVMFQWRGKYLSTSDLYTRHANEWYYGNLAAYHGLRWFMDNQAQEFAGGDSLQCPFVAAGWDRDEHLNMNPAQYLGLLKLMGGMGAESYYSSYFSLSGSTDVNGDPKSYIWQMVVPSYAQAISSRYERILHHGKLLVGDLPNSKTDLSGAMSYVYNAGDFRKYVVVRKSSDGNKFVIASSLNQNNNQIGNTEDSSTCYVTFNSGAGNEDIKFKVKRQGCVYVYDNTNPANKVFYQLDYWHENKHPYYWSTDFTMQAEVTDNYTDPQLKTTQAAGAVAGDYTDYTTYVSYADTTTVIDTLKYNVQPRAVTTYYLWVRAKSRTGATTGFQVKLDQGTAKNVNAITNTGWYWYRYDLMIPDAAHKIVYTSMSAALHHIGILPANKFLEIDQFVLTSNSAATFPELLASCTVAITGTTTFCSGSNSTLTGTTTPNTASTYLWSTAATTANIVVSTAATFTVTVTDNIGCSGTASVTTTVNALPTAGMTLSTATPCLFVPAILTATGGGTYLWSSGETTTTVSKNVVGTYTVTVTNGSGCTATATGSITTVFGSPNVSNIPAQTNICPATTVDLSAIPLTNTGTAGVSTYYNNLILANAGAGAIGAVVSTSGTYYIRITTVNGCFAVKSVAVTIIPCGCANPPSANAGVDVTACAGANVSLLGTIGGSATASTWTSSGTGSFGNASALSTTYTPSAADFTSGSVTITLTTNNPSGSPCVAAIDQLTATLSSIPTVTITPSGATTFCAGGSVALAAPSGYTYNWSTGSTLQAIIVGTTGSYIVTVTDGNGCTKASAATPVTVNAIPAVPTITPSGSVSICAGQSQTLTASSGTTYMWSTGATTSSISVSTAGSYVVTITNAAGCPRTSLPTVVSVGSALTASITPSAPKFCSGGSVNITASAATSYLWSTAATTQTIAVSIAGVYTVTVTDAFGCTKTATKGVSSTPAPNSLISATATSICSGSTSSLMATPSGGTYVWSTGATTQTISVGSAGSYTVTVTYNGCTAASPAVTITVISCNCPIPTNMNTVYAYWWQSSISWTYTQPDPKAFVFELQKVGDTTTVRTTSVKGDQRTGYVWWLNGNTQYKWRIKTYCTDIVNSDWSGWQYLKTK